MVLHDSVMDLHEPKLELLHNSIYGSQFKSINATAEFHYGFNKSIVVASELESWSSVIRYGASHSLCGNGLGRIATYVHHWIPNLHICSALHNRLIILFSAGEAKKCWSSRRDYYIRRKAEIQRSGSKSGSGAWKLKSWKWFHCMKSIDNCCKPARYAIYHFIFLFPLYSANETHQIKVSTRWSQWLWLLITWGHKASISSCGIDLFLQE